MRRYLIFVTAAAGLLMSAIDVTVVAVAFPHFIRDLHTDVLWAAWTISIYAIGVTAAMPLAGNLSDSFGRKKVFICSLILFTAGSLACGLAHNVFMLIACRFFQGLGGASFLPTASGIVSDHFPENREIPIGLLSGTWSVGAIVGPNLGGWIVSQYSWRYIFYINFPVGVVLICLILILLKDPVRSSRQRIDFEGATFFSGAILFLMLALTLIGESVSRRSVPVIASTLVLSFFLLLFFLRHETRVANPIVDVVLLRSTPFLAANLFNIVVGAAFVGVFSFVPFYATSVHRLSTLASGMILTPRSFGVIAASAVTSFLLRRLGYRWPMIVGACVIAGAAILLGQGSHLSKVLAPRLGITRILSLLMLMTGIGAGIINPPANNACIELMPEKVATIVGLRGMFRTVGGVLGVCAVTLILHLSPDLNRGFTIAFSLFGAGLLSAIPLVFLMPARRMGGPL
ncbi:MAG: MFS transporter [Syntrophorhabdales bacterium]|jgi:EmrB/QacA subfamily drug resistance transporter